MLLNNVRFNTHFVAVPQLTQSCICSHAECSLTPILHELSGGHFQHRFVHACSVIAVSAESDGDSELLQDKAFFALVHKEVFSVNK